MKRQFAILLALVMLSCLLLGCRKAESNESPEQGGVNPVTITIWEQMESDARTVFKETVNAFMGEYPHITVIHEHYAAEDLRNELRLAASGGKGPDIIYGSSNNIVMLLSEDIIVPVTDYVSDEFLDNIASNALKDGNIGGKQYSIPDISGSHIVLVYNKSLVAKAPETWEELVAASLEIRADTDDAENATYGFLYNEKEPFWFIGIFNGFGGEVMDDEYNPTLNTEAMVKALQFAKDITQVYGVGLSGMDYGLEDSKFKTGNAGMILMGLWSWEIYKEAGLDIGIAPGPVLPGGNRMTFYSSTFGYSITSYADTSKEDAIEKFMEYVFRPENNAKFAVANLQPPTVIAAADMDIIKNNEFMQFAVATIEDTVPMPIVSEMRAIWDAIRPELALVLYEDKEPAEAAAAMQEFAVDAIAVIRGE